ncbi:MAG: nucleotide sugar aminotransferase [Rhodanobacter sp.]|nr:MAG: nucleotide sugar aminotransferase [Rhodanobacter sp.]TAM11046.1 MAG: nucleotide sugar aminotransferase [Rhodanobacter sp.]TAM35555.1 MAG: nucleotide sugar aminotransferase [Rhodanobacter sp.]
MLPRRRHELPPTAGLPAHWRDLLPGRTTLAPAIADQLDVPLPVVTCSGSAALMIALATLHQRQPLRRRVVIPAYTCPLVPLAIHQAGLEPVPCDVRRGHFDLDPHALRAACDERTLAIVPTHLGGRIADVDDALAAANNVGAVVIEDAAQALGARRRGESVGCAGDLGFFSLAVGKGLTTYEGGLLVTRSEDLRQRLARTAAQLAPFNAGWELRRGLELVGYTALYRPHGLRLAYGNPLRRALRAGDPVRAVGDDFALPLPLHTLGHWRQSVGGHAASRLPAFLTDCTARAHRYLPLLRAIPGVSVLEDAEGDTGTWPFFTLLLPGPQARNRALDELWTAGLGVSRLFIHALPDYPYLAGIVPQADTPNARDFAARSLTIGNSPWLADADMKAIMQVLEKAGV